jgi:hypothetical protein
MQIHQETKQPIKENQDENAESTSTPTNGIKRKYVSPNNPLDKLTNSIKDSRNKLDSNIEERIKSES